MVGWLKNIRTTNDYVDFLNWLYAYYAPLEDRILSQLTPEVFPDMEKRKRADNLLQDMEATGIPLPAPEVCRSLPEIVTVGKALGALYVLEGSTLGGRVIATILTRQLGTEKNLSYFNSYGNETGNMWTSFTTFLDSPFPPEVTEDIHASAKATFLTFKTWIEKHELQPELRF